MEGVPQLEIPVDAELELRFGPDGIPERSRGSIAAGPGVVNLASGPGEVKLNSASAEFGFDSRTGRLDFTGLAIDFDGAIVEGEGHATYIGRNGSGSWVEGQFNRFDLSPSDANPFGLPGTGVSASSAFRFEVNPYVLRLSRALVATGDTTVLAEGEVGYDDGNWTGRVEFEADELGQDSLLALWPRGMASGARDWLTKNVSGATLRGIGGAISHASDGNWTTRLNFRFDGGTLTYLPTLPPASAVAGYAVITNRNAAFGFERGFVEVPDSGRVDLSGSDLTIPNIWDGRVPSRIRLKIAGNVNPVLSLLNYPPYLLLDKGGISLGEFDARATGGAIIDLPMLKSLKMADVSFTVEGNLVDVVASGEAGRGRDWS